MPSGRNIYNRALSFPGLKGRITPGPGGGPIRTILDFNPRNPSGRYVSFKSRLAMDWEAFHERHLYWISDADARVRRHLSQPHKLEMFLKGRASPLVYYPDIMRWMHDGTIEIIETKKSKDEISDDPEYALKIKFAQEIYEGERGWAFRVLTAEDDIEVEPVFSNAKSIKRDAPTRIHSTDKLRLLEAFDAAGGALSYGEAVRVLAGEGIGHRHAQAKLHAMIIRRLAFVNIYKEIRSDTSVLRVDDPQFTQPASARAA
jgi:hypothetical protein